jgi:hypothetical protein
VKIYSLHFCNAVLAYHFTVVYKVCVINTVVFLMVVIFKPCILVVGKLDEMSSSGI